MTQKGVINMNIFFDLGNEVLYVKVDPFINTFYHITKNMWIEKKTVPNYIWKIEWNLCHLSQSQSEWVTNLRKKITMSGPNAGQMAH